MIAINQAKAIALASEAFPHGVEAIVDALGLTVYRSALSGCDGWCVQHEDHVIIRINSNCPESRQRFTLAHELSHLLLGIPPDVIGERTRPFSSDGDEERQVNALAGELLLPKNFLKEMIDSPQIDRAMLKKIAKAAGVSETMAACRIVTMAPSLGLKNAAVLGFEGEKFRWIWSETLEISPKEATKLLNGARQAYPGLLRKQCDELVITASLLGSPQFPDVFVQRLPAELATQPTRGELIRNRADALFGKDTNFRNVLNGCISSFKTKHSGTMSLCQAIDAFRTEYTPRLNSEQAKRLQSEMGRAFLEVKLVQWFERSDPA